MEVICKFIRALLMSWFFLVQASFPLKRDILFSPFKQILDGPRSKRGHRALHTGRAFTWLSSSALGVGASQTTPTPALPSQHTVVPIAPQIYSQCNSYS